MRAASALAGALLLAACGTPGPERVVPLEVWRAAQAEGRRHGLDARVIYAIAFAESSFDPRAESSVARGLMQLTEPAWREVSDLPYKQAWDWRRNLEAGSAYLALQRQRLQRAGQFTYPLLAASYRYGYSAVQRAQFDLSRLPPPTNRVYQALFSGELYPARLLPDPHAPTG